MPSSLQPHFSGDSGYKDVLPRFVLANGVKKEQAASTL